MHWIWYERNSRRFREEARSDEGLTQCIVKEMTRVLGVKKLQVRDTEKNRRMTEKLQCSYYQVECINCAWEPPAQGMIKLNADGSITEGYTGIGGLLRNHHGEVICFYSGATDKRTIQEVELTAILEGLKIGFEMGLRRIAIASDSSNAVQYVLGETEAPWYAKDLVKEIQDLCGAMEEYSCIHVFRETNSAADFLAGLKGHKGIMTTIGPMEEQMQHIIQRDRDHVIYRRFCRK